MIDGVDHINIYSKGETELGKYLSNFTEAPFKHPFDGNFESVEGYWYYCLCGEQELRKLSGYKAKEYGRRFINPDEEWGIRKSDIKLALLCKLTQSDSMMLSCFIDSTLPFRHYYKYGNKIVEPKEGKWIVEFFENIRKMLNE